jgi:DNA end-binding protein Ku
MARAIWSGAISFGLVNVPVKLYSAVSRKTVRFNQINGATMQRVKQLRVDADSGEEVPYEQIVKGFELAPERFVVITPAELDSLDPEQTRSIDILDFVGLDEIDPIYYDHPYYLAPAQGAAKPYGLLRDAMAEAGKVGIAKVVLRSKESLVAIRPVGRILTLETMLYSDEVVPPETIDDLPDAKASAPKKRELEMARQLIESLTTSFDASAYHDEYRERVLELIERKAAGEEISVEAPAPAPAKVPDLMAALEASIKAAKGRAAGEDGDGDGAAPAPRRSAKKPAAKKPAGGNGKKPGTRTSKPKAAAKPPARRTPAKSAPSKTGGRRGS